jgi:uncharacterized protein with PIN domain
MPASRPRERGPSSDFRRHRGGGTHLLGPAECRRGAGEADRRARLRDRDSNARLGAPHRAGLRTVGKGVNPAALNFGDCLAYEVVKEHGCRLLYVGGDFARTDVESAL